MRFKTRGEKIYADVFGVHIRPGAVFHRFGAGEDAEGCDFEGRRDGHDRPSGGRLHDVHEHGRRGNRQVRERPDPDARERSEVHGRVLGPHGGAREELHQQDHSRVKEDHRPESQEEGS